LKIIFRRHSPPSNYKEEIHMKKKDISLYSTSLATPITFLLAVILITIIIPLAISSKEKTSSVTIQSENAQEVVGNFYLFRTQDCQEYLTFLENFDETKYEIVNISTSYNLYGSNEFYMVTYKTLSETG